MRKGHLSTSRSPESSPNRNKATAMREKEVSMGIVSYLLLVLVLRSSADYLKLDTHIVPIHSVLPDGACTYYMSFDPRVVQMEFSSNVPLYLVHVPLQYNRTEDIGLWRYSEVFGVSKMRSVPLTCELLQEKETNSSQTKYDTCCSTSSKRKCWNSHHHYMRDLESYRAFILP